MPSECPLHGWALSRKQVSTPRAFSESFREQGHRLTGVARGRPTCPRLRQGRGWKGSPDSYPVMASLCPSLGMVVTHVPPMAF